MAHILGFILADGCIVKGSYKGYSDSLKFGVQKGDIDIIKKIKHELDSEHTISVVKNAVYLSITSQRLVDNLKILGISYRKSLCEKIPDIPSKYIKDFIRGIVDGDGSVSIDNNGYPNLSVCGGEEVITFIRDYFLSNFDIYSKVGQRTKSKDGKHYLFSIAYRCNSAKTLLDYLYTGADLYLERKFRLAKQCLDIKIKHRKNYSIKEKQIIVQSYPSLSKDKILLMLPGRSWLAIQGQAWKLGIYKYNINKR